MNSKQRTIRKAAVLIASLDREAADAVINSMTTLQARLVRRAMVELGPIDPAEQNDVIEEFFRVAPLVARDDLEGIELDDSLLRHFGGLPALEAEEKPAPPQSTERQRETPLEFLKDADIQRLLPLVERERPQVIAVVLSHLEPERAAEILSRLPDACQVEVSHRLIELGEIDAETLLAIEEGVALWLKQHDLVQQYNDSPAQRGREAIDRILRAASEQTRHNVLSAIDPEHEATRQNVARSYEPAPPTPPAAREASRVTRHLTFDDFCRLDASTAATVISEVDREVARLALTGVDTDFVETLLAEMSPVEAKVLGEAVREFVPTVLADVELAQREVVRLAQQMAAEGKIRLNATRRLSVAA